MSAAEKAVLRDQCEPAFEGRPEHWGEEDPGQPDGEDQPEQRLAVEEEPGDLKNK